MQFLLSSTGEKTVFIFILATSLVTTYAQSKLITDVFRTLPADKIYDLSFGTRDSMLQGKTFYPADNTSDEIVAYNYGSSDAVKDYLYVSMSFETGQRASGLIEIRSFTKANGEKLIVVSQTGGVWQAAYSQHELSFFTYRKKKLTAYKKAVFPAASESTFMQPGIPDSVRRMILNNSNMSFDFSKQKPTLGLNSIYLTNDPTARKWLKGDCIYFDWVKDRFLLSKITFGAFEEEN